MADVDPAVLLLRKQTQGIHDSIRAMQLADVDSRAQAADLARSSIDTVFRLQSGQGLGIWGNGTREDQNGQTLLSRVILAPASSAARQQSGATASSTSVSAPANASLAVTPAAVLKANTSVGGSYRAAKFNQMLE